MAIPLVAGIALMLAAALFLWWVLVLIEAMRTPRTDWARAEQNQLLYVLLMVFLGIIGTIVYVAVARPRLRGAAASSLSA